MAVAIVDITLGVMRHHAERDVYDGVMAAIEFSTLDWQTRMAVIDLGTDLA